MKKIYLSMIVVMIVVVVAGAASFANFNTAGIHVIGKLAHIDMQQNCYFIDPETREIIWIDEIQLCG